MSHRRRRSAVMKSSGMRTMPKMDAAIIPPKTGVPTGWGVAAPPAAQQQEEKTQALVFFESMIHSPPPGPGLRRWQCLLPAVLLRRAHCTLRDQRPRSILHGCSKPGLDRSIPATVLFRARLRGDASRPHLPQIDSGSGHGPSNRAPRCDILTRRLWSKTPPTSAEGLPCCSFEYHRWVMLSARYLRDHIDALIRLSHEVQDRAASAKLREMADELRIMVSVAAVTDLVATLHKNVVPVTSDLFGTDSAVPESASAKQKLPRATSAKPKRKTKTNRQAVRSIPPSWNDTYPA